MAKFLNKKEQVIQFQLTPYGKYKLSLGIFKPIYYSFHDDGILYDSKYAGFEEEQNEIHNRIKNETQFLESIVVFDELENSVRPVTIGKSFTTRDDGFSELDPGGTPTAGGLFYLDAEELRYGTDSMGGTWDGYKLAPSLRRTHEINETPNRDVIKFQSTIGDARFDSATKRAAPAWKVVTLQGEISSSSPESLTTDEKIPQLNIDVNYIKRIRDSHIEIDPSSAGTFISKTDVFSDGKIIELIADDLVIYADEVNTELLTENFDIEVFEHEKIPGRSAEAYIDIGKAPTADGLPERDHPENGDIVRLRTGRGGLRARGRHFEFLTPGSSKSDSRNTRVDIYGTSSGDSVDTKNTQLARTANELLDKINARDNYSAKPAGKHAGSSVFTTTIGAPYTVMVTNLVEMATEVNVNLPISSSTSRIEVAGFVSGTKPMETFKRKFFEKKIDQVVDGFMVSANPQQNMNINLHSGSVEYYFDILTDLQVDEKIACHGAETFNKSSYYIDIDFECNMTEEDKVFYDIYGSEVGEPEICQT